MDAALELVTVGRVSVDLYSDEPGAGFSDEQRFVKSVGGSPTNVAVAAARLGHRAAVLTKVGDDRFGEYTRGKLEALGVDTRYVGVAPGLRTPLAFAALTPPDDPELMFYRDPAPDLTITPDDLPVAVVEALPVFWVTGSAFSVEPSRSTVMGLLAARGRRTHTVLDLDYRPMFWASEDDARRLIGAAVEHATVAIGNRTECEIAVGSADPDEAADRLLARGVDVAIVKMGSEGVLVQTPDERAIVAPVPVEVVCGLGAGDAFGGAVVHGLLSGWDPERVVRYANAAGAIVASRLMCADAMPTDREITELMELPVSLDDAAFRELLDVRVEDPTRIAEALRERPRRDSLTSDGMMFIVAADHTARGMVGLGDDPLAMSNRRSMLDRLLSALEHPRVDGVLASADIMEDLVLLGGLDHRVAVGTMNRGGLSGASWELDDRFTAYDPAHLVASNLDAGKMLLRIDDNDPGTVPTLQACASAVQELNDRHMLVMVEPIPYTKNEAGRAVWDHDPLQLVRAVGVCAALGGSSAYTWLKIQATADIATVAAMTTQPLLLLGGAPGPDPEVTFAAWERALHEPTVRGLVVGRALLYPPDGDVAAAVSRAADLVTQAAKDRA